MRAKRLKITADNYEGLHKVASSLPKFSKGNNEVREAMNISHGTWHYLRQSSSYEEFKELSSKHTTKKEVEVLDPVPPISTQVVGTLELGVMEQLTNINKTLVRLCEAWESTPAKKGWLK